MRTRGKPTEPPYITEIRDKRETSDSLHTAPPTTMEPPAHKTGAVESEKGREGGSGREKRTRKSKGKKTKEREREVAETKSSPEVEKKDLEVHTCSLCVHVTCMYTLAMVPFPVDISLFRSKFL